MRTTMHEEDEHVVIGDDDDLQRAKKDLPNHKMRGATPLEMHLFYSGTRLYAKWRAAEWRWRISVACNAVLLALIWMYL